MELMYDAFDLTVGPSRHVWLCEENCERSRPTLTLECDKDENGRCRLDLYRRREEGFRVKGELVYGE